MSGLTIFGQTARAFNEGKRYIVNSGGTRSGKTYSILLLLNIIARKRPNLLISVVSETYPHLRKGAIRDFQAIMMNVGAWKPDNWNKSESTFSYSNDSKIEFFSVDSPSKVHGPQRDILFINEGQSISYDIVRHLLVRTSGAVFIDFNPTHEFWAHTEYMNDEDAAWIHSTYLDNKHLTAEQVKEIERNRKNENWWRVYGEGQIGMLEGLVFPTIQLIDSMPDDLPKFYGLDFGYTNDPTAMVAVCQTGEAWYIDEMIYQTGLRNVDINGHIRTMSVNRNAAIYADSAEPKSIDDLNLYGWNVIPTVKGKDSVEWGISLMKQKDIRVTKRSLNLIKEFRNYAYVKDKEGREINQPIDAYNHAIDAARYCIMMLQRQKVDYQPTMTPQNRRI